MAELTEKSIMKDIQGMIKDSSKLEETKNYEIKHNILSLMGFGNEQENNFPELKNKKFISRHMPIIVEELLSGSHVDLDILKKIVEVQNGIYNINISPAMKECLDEGMLRDRSEIEVFKNIKKLKFHAEAGNIDLEEGFFDTLSKQSKVMSSQPLSREDNLAFSSQIPVSQESYAGIKSKNSSVVEDITPLMETNWQEEARKRFYQKAEEMNAIERKYYTDDKSLDKRSNNKYLDKMYEKYFSLKRKVQNPFESKGLVQMANDSNTPLRQMFKYPTFGKGVRFDKFPDDKEAAQIYELAALKVRADGIENPYVYTKRARNALELRQKEAFVRGQIKALVAVGYEIESITVDPEMNAVYEGIKQNILKDRLVIGESKSFVEEAKYGKLSPDNKIALLSRINFEGAESNDDITSLIKDIEADKPLGENKIKILEERLKEAKNYMPESREVTPEDVDNKIPRELSTEEENLDVAPKTLGKKQFELGEQELLDNNCKLLKSFSDFKANQGSPEMVEGQIYRNIDAQNIMNIKSKIDENPELKAQLDETQVELINKKAALIDINTKSSYPEIMLGVVNMVLNNQYGIQSAWSKLEPDNIEIVNQVLSEGFGNVHDFLSSFHLDGLMERPELDYPVAKKTEISSDKPNKEPTVESSPIEKPEHSLEEELEGKTKKINPDHSTFDPNLVWTPDSEEFSGYSGEDYNSDQEFGVYSGEQEFVGYNESYQADREFYEHAGFNNENIDNDGFEITDNLLPESSMVLGNDEKEVINHEVAVTEEDNNEIIVEEPEMEDPENKKENTIVPRTKRARGRTIVTKR